MTDTCERAAYKEVIHQKGKNKQHIVNYFSPEFVFVFCLLLHVEWCLQDFLAA